MTPAMIVGYAYITVILAATAYVLCVGDWNCRLSMTTLFAGSALTLVIVYLSGTYFTDASVPLIVVDFLILAVFTGHALWSPRYWPIAIAGLQLNTCLAHLAKLGAPEILPKVYSAGQGHWAWIQMPIIFFAAMYVRARTIESKRHGRTRDET